MAKYSFTLPAVTIPTTEVAEQVAHLLLSLRQFSLSHEHSCHQLQFTLLHDTELQQQRALIHDPCWS